jgi:hypothetical protein
MPSCETRRSNLSTERNGASGRTFKCGFSSANASLRTRQHRGNIDIINDDKLWPRDLHAAWKMENERTRLELPRANADVTWVLISPQLDRRVGTFHAGQRQKCWPADAIIENSSKELTV